MNTSVKKTEAKKKRKKNRPWSNFGDGLQVYDVCYEVDKLDHFRNVQGKDSEDYKRQHKKAVSMMEDYNKEFKRGRDLKLSRCRAIIAGEKHIKETKYYNKGKKVAGNRGAENGQ